MLEENNDVSEILHIAVEVAAGNNNKLLVTILVTVEHKIGAKRENCHQYKTKEIKAGQRFANISQ